MRILQKRTKAHECLRQSEVEGYKKQFKQCYNLNFNEEDEFTDDFT